MNTATKDLLQAAAATTTTREVPRVGWAQWPMLLAGFSLGVILMTGCEPDDVPRFSPDGKKVALLLGLDEESYHQAPIPISVVTLADGRLRHYPLPENWSPRGFIWLDQRLLISAARPTNGPVEPGARLPAGDQGESRYLVLDTRTGSFSKPSGIFPSFVQTPFLGMHRERRCLYVPDWEESADKDAGIKWKTEIVLATDLSALGSLPFELQGVGDGWMIRMIRPVPDPAGKLLSIEILNPQAQKISQIPSELLPEAFHLRLSPDCGKISQDHSQLLLGEGADSMFQKAPNTFGFAVYDVHSGKRLWMGRSNSLRGLPVVTKNAVYALEINTREGLPSGSETNAAVPGVSLIRHTKEGSAVTLEIPLLREDLASRYSHSYKGDRFVLLVEGPHPRLLLIPVRDHLGAKEIVSVPLVAQAPNQR